MHGTTPYANHETSFENHNQAPGITANFAIALMKVASIHNKAYFNNILFYHERIYYSYWAHYISPNHGRYLGVKGTGFVGPNPQLRNTGSIAFFPSHHTVGIAALRDEIVSAVETIVSFKYCPCHRQAEICQQCVSGFKRSHSFTRGIINLRKMPLS